MRVARVPQDGARAADPQVCEGYVNNGPEAGQPRLEFDPDGFAEAERLVAYEIGDALLMLNLELQQRYDLRAEEHQVFLLIVLCTAQRFVRSTDADSDYLGRTPLPPELSSSISRRRISEVLGIPLKTVRRIVTRLLERGMIVEKSRGKLSTPGGTLKSLGEDAIPEKIVRRFITAINRMIRVGAIRATDRD